MKYNKYVYNSEKNNKWYFDILKWQLFWEIKKGLR